jgi:hypothetical protein
MGDTVCMVLFLIPPAVATICCQTEVTIPPDVAVTILPVVAVTILPVHETEEAKGRGYD